MNKRILSLLLAALMLCLLCACGDDDSPLTTQEAEKIALEESGLSDDQVSDIHTHITEVDGVAAYSVHITAGGAEYEFIIDGFSGEVLSR